MPRTANGDRDPLAKLVLYALCDMDNQNDPSHTVWPSQQTLSTRTGLAGSTVAARLADLERDGYLQREQHHYAKGPRKGQKGNDHIRINLDRPPDDLDRRREQPEALRGAKPRSRSSGNRVAQRGDEVRLPGSWADDGEECDGDADSRENHGPWWDDSVSESPGPLVRIDGASGEVTGTVGTFGNPDRPTSRRKPPGLWSKRDVEDEVLDRFWWARWGDEMDREVAVTALGRLHAQVHDFDPHSEVSVINDLFADEVFLNLLPRDDGSAASVLIAALFDIYGLVPDATNSGGRGVT